jgi:hypothetical protein
VNKSRDVAFADYDVLDAAARVCDRIAAKSGTDASLAAAGAALRVVNDIERGAAVAEKDDSGQIRAVYKAMPGQHVRYKQAAPADEIDQALQELRQAAVDRASTTPDSAIAAYIRQCAAALSPNGPMGTAALPAATKAAPPRDGLDALFVPAVSSKAVTQDPFMSAVRRFTGDE